MYYRYIYIYNNPIYVYVQIKQNKKSSSAENIKKIHCTYVAYINQKTKSFVSFFETLPQKSNSKKPFHEKNTIIVWSPNTPPKNETPYPQNQKKSKYPYKQTSHWSECYIIEKIRIVFEKTKILYSLNSRLLNETTPLTQFDGKNWHNIHTTRILHIT